jgi:hypothetical protein
MKKQGNVNPPAAGARVRRGFRKLVDLGAESKTAQALLERYLQVLEIDYQRLLGDGFIRYAVQRGEDWSFVTSALLALAVTDETPYFNTKALPAKPDKPERTA